MWEVHYDEAERMEGLGEEPGDERQERAALRFNGEERLAGDGAA